MSILLQEAKAELGLDVWGDLESEPSGRQILSV